MSVAQRWRNAEHVVFMARRAGQDPIRAVRDALGVPHDVAVRVVKTIDLGGIWEGPL